MNGEHWQTGLSTVLILGYISKGDAVDLLLKTFYKEDREEKKSGVINVVLICGTASSSLTKIRFFRNLIKTLYLYN